MCISWLCHFQELCCSIGCLDFIKAAKARLEELQGLKKKCDEELLLAEKCGAAEAFTTEAEEAPEETPEGLPEKFLQGHWSQDAQPPPPLPASPLSAKKPEESLEATQIEASQVQPGNPTRESGELAQQQPSSDDECMMDPEDDVYVDEDGSDSCIETSVFVLC